jgi:hypothetical protein
LENKFIRPTPRFKTWDSILPGATRAARGILGIHDHRFGSSISAPVRLSFPDFRSLQDAQAWLDAQEKPRR